MKPLQPIGAIFRGLFGAVILSKPDRVMREAIARLDAVSDSIATTYPTDRASAVDDLANSR